MIGFPVFHHFPIFVSRQQYLACTLRNEMVNLERPPQKWWMTGVNSNICWEISPTNFSFIVRGFWMTRHQPIACEDATPIFSHLLYSPQTSLSFCYMVFNILEWILKLYFWLQKLLIEARDIWFPSLVFLEPGTCNNLVCHMKSSAS